ncbi:uncharacterized protein ATNIH1004_010916 [Aspergillus tanneri]|uniref:Uncharacterized protein n=1 Tax=Aspergillus tanneri TaxID=1220188 RepID=A0A5M9MG89_9EURO|nr:uncharacterized protein ATNIH1004_010916 [Aspergillus tanneri]KAA8641977.1 hypothetical protein ATNIH1004_010916 [Aspergillus tanneri]
MAITPFYRHPDTVAAHPEIISKIAPFSALIISVILVILFLVRYYVLEAFLIRRLYGSTYTNLSAVNQRGFINHHIAGATKILILFVAAYPFVKVIIGNSSFHTPYHLGSQVTMGGYLHRGGANARWHTAIAISLEPLREPDADIEFMLCTIWGVFDIISEFFPHVAIVLYRVYPQRHRFLSRVFLLSCITTAFGTLCETVVIMFLFGCLWQRWQIAFKVITPMLHAAFSAAQIHGSVVFWRMYRRQRRLLLEEANQHKELGETSERDESGDSTRTLNITGCRVAEV